MDNNYVRDATTAEEMRAEIFQLVYKDVASFNNNH